MQYSADGRHPRRKVELTAGQPYNVPTFRAMTCLGMHQP
jgi:hypothetical protein